MLVEDQLQVSALIPQKGVPAVTVTELLGWEGSSL